jgi:glycosyltransferase involved in cell wall biosynthesis
MDITACICTRDRPQYLRDCLNGLSQQTVGTERFDILVVDSASCGQTPALIARLVAGIANARLLRMERPGVSFARNAVRRPLAAATSPISTMMQYPRPTGSSASWRQSPKPTRRRR